MKEFLRRRWKLLAAAALVLPVLAFVGLGLLIGHGVDQAVEHARRAEGEDPVEALTRVALSDGYPLEKRNRAIWALGQLGDPAALPALESLATGGDCEHTREVCQKEVRKALQRCRDARDLPALASDRGP